MSRRGSLIVLPYGFGEGASVAARGVSSSEISESRMMGDLFVPKPDICSVPAGVTD